MGYKKLWFSLAAVVVASFIVLGYFGYEVYMQAPPIPERIISENGQVLFTGDDIRNGQNVWQSIGGQEVGSVWGHGAYVAPDWSADFLHRELTFILDFWANTEDGKIYSNLPAEKQAAFRERLKLLIRKNTYDPTSKDLTLDPVNILAIESVGKHYTALFTGDPSLAKLRESYALQPKAITNPESMRQMLAFFYWATWACSTTRPDGEVTYTNNWPPESLIGNAPTGSIIVWSVFSFVFLLAGIGTLAWYFASQRAKEELENHEVPDADPLLGLEPTPSMQATLKYFWVAGALLVVQVGLGALTAHYGVEGSGFYGIPLAQWLPYAVTRTWHTQLGIFWIATTWLATGLFMGPAVSGFEPKFQRAGVNLLFTCLVLIVVGSMAGEWLGVQQKLGLDTNFWFGHQGYEYVDLGRFWQIFLFIGLFLWLALMTRAIWPAFKNPLENRSLLSLFLISSLAIAGFYGAGLMYGQHTNLAIAEYWRWWVVHLWVEGFFEVFATVVIAFLFTRMRLLSTVSATASVLFSTTIFLAGGIIGTMHHLYFSGTPTPVLAWGATFSALEVVPLTLIGFEGYGNLTLSKVQPWVQSYKWPINFFVAVTFWNLVGAGLFGFLINAPIALYYMQGLNTTAVHAHTALFGVYGMLAIGLMLFCLKGLGTRYVWKTGPVKFAFWSINIGLSLMVLISLLPVGLMQTWASVEYGLWYARSSEFLQTDLMNILRWLRVIGDTIFAIGVVALAWFVLGLKTGWSVSGQIDTNMPPRK
ncbi:MAG: nitric-oxide reductase large subunit [Candidatus Obscuribacterales bacterium]|nr:nitric-oxide reductase large subunit [Candidatus Obscuribacterales bacterium]